jgi:hypothetical protein
VGEAWAKRGRSAVEALPKRCRSEVRRVEVGGMGPLDGLETMWDGEALDWLLEAMGEPIDLGAVDWDALMDSVGWEGLAGLPGGSGE